MIKNGRSTYTGTSVPAKRNETKATVRPTVTIYYLTPEELAKYRALPVPKPEPACDLRRFYEH